MARYGHLNPDEMHNELKSHYETQPKLFKGQDAHDIASTSAADYRTGHDTVEQVKATLQKLSAQQQNPEHKQQIDLAINSLDEATTAFGNACLVQNNHWSPSES